MSVSALDHLIRILIDGTSVESFKSKAAFRVWSGAKTRRILVWLSCTVCRYVCNNHVLNVYIELDMYEDRCDSVYMFW